MYLYITSPIYREVLGVVGVEWVVVVGIVEVVGGVGEE
ncbi:unnamed protein product [Camellia sinensis]